MSRGKLILVIIVLVVSITGLKGQTTYFPHSYRYPPGESLNLMLLEELYQKARLHLNNGDIEGLETSSFQMNSLAFHDYPLYDGLMQTQEGVIHYFKGNNSTALQHFLKALNIYSEEEFYSGVNTLLNNIAIVFALVGDYQSSKKYLLRAIDINQKENLDHYDLFRYNLAEVEAELGNYVESLDILKGLLRNDSITLRNISPVSVIASIITAYNKLGNNVEAESWINRGYLSMDENRYSELDGLAFYTSVMEFYLNKGEYEKVINTSLQFDIDERYRLPDQYDHLEYLCMAYAATGDFDKAWKYDRILNEIQTEDDIVNREDIITLLMIEYVETRNLRQKESIEQEMEINNARRNASRRLIIIFSVILVAFFVLFIVLLRIRRLRNRYIEEFRVETEKFASVNRELQRTNRELEKENKLLDTLISVFAHDLINPFQAILGFSKLMVDDFEALDKESMQEYSSMLGETSFQLNQLLINLQSIATIQEGKDKLEISDIKIGNIINDVISLYRPLAERKNLSFTEKVDEKTVARINPDIFKSVIRNVINNAIKYSNTDGEIRIFAKEEQESVIISIEDDGTGISDEVRESVLRGNYLMSKPGTGSEKGSGLGLTICIDLLEMNHGKLDIDNSREEGTTIILIIPKPDA